MSRITGINYRISNGIFANGLRGIFKTESRDVYFCILGIIFRFPLSYLILFFILSLRHVIRCMIKISEDNVPKASRRELDYMTLYF